MRRRPATTRADAPRALRPRPLPLLLAGLLGLAAAVLIACGSSSKGLIPLSKAGPLQNDFEVVRQAAETGNGKCGATEAALLKTAEDFNALPATVDDNLRNTLRQGIDNLRSRALALCTQPLAGVTTESPKTTTTTTTPTTTEPSTTTTTPTTPTTEPPSENGGTGGGTPAPGGSEAPGAGGEQGATELGESRSGGASGENGGTGGLEGGK